MEKGRLRDKIAQKPGLGASVNLRPSCALLKPCNLCHRHGYTITTRDGVVAADLCHCVHTCAHCFGSMMLQSEGKTKACHEPNPRRIVSLFGEAKIPARYRDASIDQFQNFTGNARQVLGKIDAWLKTFTPEGGPGLILSGPVGVGKTYILAAIAKQLIEQGMSVKFTDFHRLLAVIRAGYADRRSEEDVLAPLINAEVLIVDEFGKSQGKDWEVEKLDQIVMGRYNQNKVIIASTNYSLKRRPDKRQLFNAPLDVNRSSFNPDEFENLETRVGQRIFSRLIETSLMLTIEGEDYRRRPNGDVRI